MFPLSVSGAENGVLWAGNSIKTPSDQHKHVGMALGGLLTYFWTADNVNNDVAMSVVNMWQQRRQKSGRDRAVRAVKCCRSLSVQIYLVQDL